MTLGEIVARIDAFADGFEIRARLPWTAESEAFVVEPGDGSAVEFVCRIGDAKEKLRAYVGDPEPMRVSRVVAYGESLRADRRAADKAARTFSITGRSPAGYFEDVRRPDAAGQYRYMPYRSSDHHELTTSLRAGRSVRCSMTDGTFFVAVASPRYGVLEIAEVGRGPRIVDGPLRMMTLSNPPPSPAPSFDLRDVLELVRLELPGTRWRLAHVDFDGDSECLGAAGQRPIVLGGTDLFALSRSVHQIIDGDFAGSRADGAPWILVRVVRHKNYDIATRDASVVERVRARFPHAEDVPMPEDFGVEFLSYFGQA